MPQTINVRLKKNSYNIIIGDSILEKIDDLHRQHFGQRSKIIIFDKKLPLKRAKDG
jgi:3-dehydroquinate synthetase